MHMGKALDESQDLIDADPSRQGVVGGSCEGKNANFERAKSIFNPGTANEHIILDFMAVL